MSSITPELVSEVNSKLENLLHALETHLQFSSSPNGNGAPYFVWDFVRRGKYMPSEYDNIKNGRPIQHPEQFSPAPSTNLSTSGEAAATKIFQEVYGRTIMLNLLVNDTSGMNAMMTDSSGPPIDFGRAIKDAVAELERVVPEEHMMAGTTANINARMTWTGHIKNTLKRFLVVNLRKSFPLQLYTLLGLSIHGLDCLKIAMDRGKRGVIVACIFTGLALIFVTIRLISRAIIIRFTGLDDYLVILGLVLSIGVTVDISIQLYYGLGQHADVVGEDGVRHILQLLYASIVLYNLGLYAIKSSICVQSLRIFTIRKYSLAAKFLLGFIIVGGGILLFIQIFSCLPVAKSWDTTIKGKCLPPRAVWFTASAFAIVTDFCVWVLPIPILSKLQIPRKQKYALLFVFLLGFFGCLVGIIRLQSIYAASSSTDLTYTNVSSAMWSSIELNIGIVCACIPTIRPVLGIWFPRLISSTRQASNPTTHGPRPSRVYQQFNNSTIELSQIRPGFQVSVDRRDDDADSTETTPGNSTIQVKQEWEITSHAAVPNNKN
ncbi:hypothetical protein B7494_g8190 [Chlorociboria aeruginascens]|nr:hypothetical protein B7494_g8190 [Chlorociboria aeruginascens]